MVSDGIPVYVLTSDNYLHALRPFAHLFNKYWDRNQGAKVIGFTPPSFDLPNNFGFQSLGEFSDYPVDKWSDALIKFLEGPGCEDTFVLMLEDYWLTRPVDIMAVKMLYYYAVQFGYVLKIDLCGDRLYAAGMTDYGTCGRLDLVKSHHESQYHMSLMCGVWNRKQLLKFLIPGETPWEVELHGTPLVREANTDVVVLGTRQWPVRHTLGLRSGNSEHYYLEEIKEADIDDLVEHGYLPQTKTKTEAEVEV